MPIIGPKIQESCPLRGHWASFRLVDEYGKGEPYAGLRFTLHDRRGQLYTGLTDSEGFGCIEDFYQGAIFLDLSSPYGGAVDPWYDRLKLREQFKIPLTAIQVAAEQTPCAHRKPDDPHLPKLRAEEEKAIYYHVQVSDFVPDSAAAHLPNHEIPDSFPNPVRIAEFKAYFEERGEGEKAGIVLQPCKHHVLEVKALRAYSPIFSRGKAFCALNCYHLAVMSAFVYAPFSVDRKADERHTAPSLNRQQKRKWRRNMQSYSVPGSIGRVLHDELAHLEKSTLFNDAGPYHLLCEEVPYSKRLEVMPWDNVRYTREKEDGWEFPEDVHFLNHASDTQAFITHNDQIILISIRGTWEFADKLRDADARQIPHEDGLGQAHRGFHEAFASTKKFIQQYIDAFYTGEQTILVVGHSLGGAIALLAAEWIRRLPENPEVILYTFGAPRAGDTTFVREAKDLPHHRMVNHNDPVPGVPFTWMDAEWKTLATSAVLVASGSLVLGIGGIIASLVNMKGDPYEHHGEQRHFIPRKPGAGSEAKILWQPGCMTLEHFVCALYTAELELQGDMPERVSLGETVMSIKKHFGDHSSHTGYSRAALANLLRWRSSVMDRNGALFTYKESEQLADQVRDIEARMKTWVPGTFADFYARRHTDPHMAGKTQLELQAAFTEAYARVEALANTEIKELKRTRKRLQAQAEQPITLKDVFGDQAERADLDALLNQWLALADIQKAALLAKAARAIDLREA